MTKNKKTDEEIVRYFFKRSIEIMDKGLDNIFAKYPNLKNEKKI